MTKTTAANRPARRRQAGIAVALVVVGLLVVVGPAASDTRYFDSFFGGTSAAPHLGGLFGSANSGVGDLAVNDSEITTDGTSQSGFVYVVDRGNGRVQAFDENNNFQFAIGRDVVQPGGVGDTNERQTVTVGGGPTGGSFTLTFGANTTTPIAFNAPASGAGSVQEALQAIASVGSGNATVTGPAGGPYAVEFVGARASVDHVAMTTNASGLTPAGTVTVATTRDGASFEKCTVAAQCKVGTSSTAALGNQGAFGVAEGIDIDQETGHFFVVDRSTRRVQEFEADGDFVRLWGWNVVARGGVGNVPINEKQTIALDPNADGGTFTLSFGFPVPQTTAPIDAEAAPAAVQSALNALTPIGPGGTTVTGPPGGPWTVEFTGGQADTNVSQLNVDPAGLSAAVGTSLNCTAGPASAATRNIQWLRNGAPIPGATSLSYTTVVADSGKAVQCQVTALNANAGSTQMSNPPIVVSPVPVPALPGAPSIAAPTPTNPVAGTTETCAPGTWTGSPTFTFQWYRNGVALPGATSNTYVVQAADVPSALQCAVTGTNGGGAVTRASALRNTSPAPSPSAPSASVSVSGLSFPVVTTIAEGSDAFETCTAASGDVCQNSDTQAGTNPGQIGFNSQKHGLAVPPPSAPNAGNLYIADPGNRRVLPYAIPGNPAASVTADPSFGSATEFTTVDWPRDIAADSNGVVYATTSTINNANGNTEVLRYDTAIDVFETSISPAFDDNFFGRGLPAGLEIDHSTGYLLVGRAPNPALNDGLPGTGLLELDVSDNPVDVDDSDIVDIHGVGLGIFNSSSVATLSPNGIGVNPASGRFYLSVSTGPAATGAGQRIVFLDETGVDPPPTVTLLPPEDVGCSDARLQAEINPNGPTGFATNYRFQVSKTGRDDDWVDIAPDALVGATGDGNSPVPIDDDVSGLDANSQYRVRVRTTRNPSAGTAISAELSFVTDPCPPTAQTTTAQQVTDTSARLVGQVDPGGVPTTYWFDWGDSSYGKQAPVPAASAGSGGSAKPVDTRLTGLEPERVFHFRLCAQNQYSPAPVCGADRSFTTRAPVAASASRAYEMVTSPSKVLRRGGEPGGTGPFGSGYGHLQGALPSRDGDSALWSIFAGVSDPDVGNAYAFERTFEVRRRQPDRWIGDPVANIPPAVPFNAGDSVITGVSDDLNTHAWYHTGRFFSWPSGGQTTRVMGDTGGDRLAGWYPWLDPDWYTGLQTTADKVLIDGAGKRGLRWIDTGNFYRDLRPLDDTVTPGQLSPPQTSGSAVFMTGGPIWAPLDLINECTGSGAGSTELPARMGTGVAGDLIGTSSCAAGSPTSVRGASAGGGSKIFLAGGPLAGTATTALSDDGRRVFFLSPEATTSSPSTCATTVGTATDCPPQLFVRQYDDDGNPTVRWISRAVDDLFDAPQQIGELGNGVGFEGASHDGKVVYFRTNAPLTIDDPNGGNSQTTGVASPNSWDLYRYALPSDSNADPADGELTRVSAGPVVEGTGDVANGSPTVTGVAVTTGTFAVGQRVGGAGIPANATIVAVGSGTLTLSTNATATANGVALTAAADSNTNCSAIVSGNCSAGGGAAARFMSDEGDRVYFVTTTEIPGAQSAPPAGGATTPGGAQVNTTSRNLYLYDSNKTGASAYKFIARIPFSTNGFDSCSSYHALEGGMARAVGVTLNINTLPAQGVNCVHGTSSGDAIAFETTGQLTTDDTDAAADIYLYDAEADELIRLSAPPVDAGTQYGCLTTASSATPSLAVCNGDFGVLGGTGNQPTTTSETVGLGGLRHQNIAEDDQGHLKAVYFQSRLELTDDDVNGDRMDVYEWRDGSLRLLTSGLSNYHAFYTGNGKNGDSVFFWTEERIDPREIDDEDGDLYVARVGDGFPAPVSPPPICSVLAEGCQGDPGGSQIDAPAATDKPGGGNLEAGDRPKFALSGLTAAQRKQAAKSGVLPVRVSTDHAGKVSTRALAKIDRPADPAERVGKEGVANATAAVGQGRGIDARHALPYGFCSATPK